MHMKRVTSPKFWKAGRKNKVWIFTPRPGPHPKRFCFPLSVLLRDVLGLVSDAREARAAIKHKEILIDGIPRRDTNFSVGFMDVVSIPSMKKHYRVIPVPKGLQVIEITEKESKLKAVKVVSKQLVNGKIQITTHDGRNFLGVENVKTGDTLIIEFGKEGKAKIKKTLKSEEGMLMLVFKGRQSGRLGTFKSVNKTMKMKGGQKIFEAPTDYVMVIGKDKAEIKVSGE